MRRIDVAQVIAHNSMACADHENSTELHAVELIVFHQNVLGFHVDVGVVKDDAEVAEGVIFGLAAIDAGISLHAPVVEAVEVDALAIDLFEPVVFVSGALDITGRVDSHGRSASFGVDQRDRESNASPAIAVHFYSGCVADLDRVAAYFRKLIVGDLPALITRRTINRMRPNAVAANVLKPRVGDREIIRAFLQQDAAGCIVATLGVSRAAISNLNMIQQNVSRTIHENREARYVYELDVVGLHAVRFFEQDAIVRENRRERFVGWRDRHRLFQRGSIAVDRKIIKLDPPAILAAKQGATAEAGRSAQGRVISGDREIVRAFWKPQLRRHLDCAGRQMKYAARRKRERSEQCEDQALFYLAWRSNFAASIFPRFGISTFLRRAVR